MLGRCQSYSLIYFALENCEPVSAWAGLPFLTLPFAQVFVIRIAQEAVWSGSMGMITELP